MTSKMCRFMHGHVFSVARSMKRVREGLPLRDPKAFGTTSRGCRRPKTRVARGPSTTREITGARSVTEFQEKEIEVPDPSLVIDEGRNNNEGPVPTKTIDFNSNTKSNHQLQGLGVTIPPLHAHCRSTIEPKGIDGQQHF